jgi:hypothetical protein
MECCQSSVFASFFRGCPLSSGDRKEDGDKALAFVGLVSQALALVALWAFAG